MQLVKKRSDALTENEINSTKLVLIRTARITGRCTIFYLFWSSQRSTIIFIQFILINTELINK